MRNYRFHNEHDSFTRKSHKYKNNVKKVDDNESQIYSVVNMEDQSDILIQDLDLEKNLKDETLVYQSQHIESHISQIQPYPQIDHSIYYNKHDVRDNRIMIQFEFNSLTIRNIKNISFLELNIRYFCTICSFLINGCTLSMNNSFKLSTYNNPGELKLCNHCCKALEIQFRQNQFNNKIQSYNQIIVLGLMVLSQYVMIHNKENIIQMRNIKLRALCDCEKSQFEFSLDNEMIQNKFSFQRFCDVCWKVVYFGFRKMSFIAKEYQNRMEQNRMMV